MAAPADVLVVAAPGAETTGKLLADELEAVGLSVKRQAGSEHVFEAKRSEGQHRSVVWLDEDGGARIWLRDGADAEPPHQVEASETPQLLALRTAELVRARLIPDQEGTAPEGEAGALDDAPRALPETRFLVLGGPGLIVSSYAEPLPAFSLGFMYRPWTKLSVGAFGSGSLARNRWFANPEQLVASQLTIGARLAVRWLDPPAGQFHSDLLFRTALRRIQVQNDKGGPMEDGTANLWGPTFDLGVDGTWELTRWFGLGFEACFIVGLPLARSVFKKDGMPPGDNAPVLPATESTDPDFQVTTSFLAVATW